MMYQLLDISASTIDWSRGQFALTAIYHWLFVPLTLGLALIMGIVETCYYRTKKRFWKDAAKFWQKLFGVNFAMGVATGIILEFEFGTNWSNYSWFVGDIFGAPLAIEGILAFFMESTFVAVMFFGWKKVSPGFHLASTWLTGLGATLSAWWILVANAWMQYPVGQTFNPDTMRFEFVFRCGFITICRWKVLPHGDFLMDYRCSFRSRCLLMVSTQTQRAAAGRKQFEGGYHRWFSCFALSSSHRP